MCSISALAGNKPEKDESIKKILFLIPYFGHWPTWFPFYLESCRWNPTIDWLFFTDCDPIPNPPENVRFVSFKYSDYQQLICDRLNINFNIDHPYKLCDIRPAYGYLHQEYLSGYDYFGFGDIDVIYGDIRSIYTESVLSHNTISTVADRVSGHLFLIKNEERWINAFRRIHHWPSLMTDPTFQTIDEYWFSRVLRGYRQTPPALRKIWGLWDPHKRNHLFQERHSTPLAEWPWIDGSYNYPDQWYWYQGKLTNEYGGEFLYLHFMNWKSSQYLRKRYGDKAAWETLPQLIDPTLTDLDQGWCISSKGFSALPDRVRSQWSELLESRGSQLFSVPNSAS
jgi:hypothetical protein